MDKIICVGKNYLEHAKELNALIGDSIPEMPVLFLKPPSSLKVSDGKSLLELPFPDRASSVHHECEIVLRLGQQGKIEAITLGLDLTLRDTQAQLKKNGHPWEISKVFPGSAVIGPWIDIQSFPEWMNEEFSFSLDGSIKQKGRAQEMRLAPIQCIQYAAQHFEICPGDLLFTGTPAGVGPITRGQKGRLTWGEKLRYDVAWR